MVSKFLYFVFLIVWSILIGCSVEDTAPLETVIKLNSAESIGDFDSANRYIDVELVYGEISRNEGTTAEIIWKEKVNALNSIVGSSKKFTSCFKYHLYDIEQDFISKIKCSIRFSLIDYDNQEGIKYTLEKRGDHWIITSIERI